MTKNTIGTDIVSVNRIKKLAENHDFNFYRHVYTDEEVLWCNDRSSPHIHLAGRFAAKEAAAKALGGKPEFWFKKIQSNALLFFFITK